MNNADLATITGRDAAIITGPIHRMGWFALASIGDSSDCPPVEKVTSLRWLINLTPPGYRRHSLRLSKSSILTHWLTRQFFVSAAGTLADLVVSPKPQNCSLLT